MGLREIGLAGELRSDGLCEPLGLRSIGLAGELEREWLCQRLACQRSWETGKGF